MMWVENPLLTKRGQVMNIYFVNQTIFGSDNPLRHGSAINILTRIAVNLNIIIALKLVPRIIRTV